MNLYKNLITERNSHFSCSLQKFELRSALVLTPRKEENGILDEESGVPSGSNNEESRVLLVLRTKKLKRRRKMNND